MSSDLQYGVCAVHIQYYLNNYWQNEIGWAMGIPGAGLKVLEDRKNKFHAIKVSIFKPDHCCRKIKSPLRFLQTHMRSNNLNWGSGEQQAQNNSALFSIMQSMKDLKTSVVSRLLVFLSTNSICGLLQWR